MHTSVKGWIYRILLVCLITTLVVSCSKTDELFVYENQEWKVKHSLSYSSDIIPSIGIPLFEQIGIRINLGAVTNEFVAIGLNQLAHAYRSFGFKADWDCKKLGDKQTYILILEGNGWEDLADIGLGGDPGKLAVVEDEYIEYIRAFSNQVQIEEKGNNQIYLTMSAPEGFSEFPLFQSEFIIHAGKIISSNATTQKRNTATWENPTHIEVTFTPITSFWSQYWWILAAAGALIVVGIAAVLIIRSLSSRGRGRSARRLPRPLERRGTSRSSRSRRISSSRRSSSRRNSSRR